MRFLKATIALICLPAIASAWGNLYARNAEAEALANPHAYAEAEAWAEAYANAIADADADAYTEADEEIDLQTRDTDASAEQEEHLSLYARYADAYAEPYTDADAGFLSFYERDALPYPVPVKDLTREQIAACRQRANKGTAEYKQLEAAFRTVLAKYSSERNLETRIKLAEQLARASQSVASRRIAVLKEYTKMGKNDKPHQHEIQKWRQSAVAYTNTAKQLRDQLRQEQQKKKGKTT